MLLLLLYVWQPVAVIADVICWLQQKQPQAEMVLLLRRVLQPVAVAAALETALGKWARGWGVNWRGSHLRGLQTVADCQTSVLATALLERDHGYAE